MAKEVDYIDLGRIDYSEAWQRQRELFDALIEKKLHGDVPARNTFIMCEHNHVYTLGKSGHSENLLIQPAFLEKIGATFYKIERGGDITYHGPGQIVGYPIIDIEEFGISLKEYIFKIEKVIIDTIAEFGIVGERLAGATGVWIDSSVQGRARKICAIGVKASRFVTMHGFALNVNTNLDYFSYINPCGFVDKGVTSIQKEVGHEVDMNEVKYIILKHFGREFGVSISREDVHYG